MADRGDRRPAAAGAPAAPAAGVKRPRDDGAAPRAVVAPTSAVDGPPAAVGASLPLPRPHAAPAPSPAAAAAAAAAAAPSNWAKLKAKVARPAAAGAPGPGAPPLSPPAAAPAAAAGAAGAPPPRAGGAGGGAGGGAAGGAPGGRPPETAAAAAARAAALATLHGPFPPPSVPLTPDEARVLALDCEMVGVGPGGARSALAFVVVVDWHGRVVLSEHVRPTEPVTDYRTHVSGVRPEHLRGPGVRDLPSVQASVASLLTGRLLVGHGLINDMRALLLSHPWHATRDTAVFRHFVRRTATGHVKPRRLKHLVAAHLGAAIQTGEHEPAEDARAALALYKLFRRDWEHELTLGHPPPGATTVGRGGKRPRR
jgi:RNA exonuclease 4